MNDGFNVEMIEVTSSVSNYVFSEEYSSDSAILESYRLRFLANSSIDEI